MRRQLRPTLFCSWRFWAVLAAAPLVAQPGELELEKLSVEDGLSHSTVGSIHQDAEGFLWFGTQEGLNRYDGIRFEVYKHGPDEPDSLSESEVMVVYGDRRGDLWVGTLGGGLNRRPRGGGAFVRYRHDPADPRALSSDIVLSLLEDAAGTLWVGTEAGLDRFLGPSVGFSRVHPEGPAAPDPSDLGVRALFEDRSGRLWIGTDQGLFERRRRTGVWEPRPLTDDAPRSFAVEAITEDAEGRLWIGGRDGLYSLDPSTGASRRYREPTDPESESPDPVLSLLVDRAGDLWIGTEGRGLIRRPRGSKTFRRYRHEALDPFSLSDDTIHTLFEDRTGILWIGGFVGINKYDPAREQFVTYRQRGHRGLASSSVWAILEDRSGALWVGSYDSGLARIDRETGEIVHHRPDPDDSEALPSGAVSALIEDGAGDLWVGTWGGLSRLVGAGGRGGRDRFVTYRRDPDHPESHSDPGVAALYLDSSGRFWVATYSGLDLFDPATGRFTPYGTGAADSESPGGLTFYDIREDPAGQLWLGSDTAGLYRLDPGSGRFTAFRHDSARAGSLSSDKIACLYVDPAGELWVGTYGGGLNRLDRERQRFLYFREKDGLANDTVLGILRDAGGHLWLSTNNGLSRFDPRTGSCANYGVEDGLQGRVYSTGASFRSARSGEMFFGGVGGLDAFFPQQITGDPHPPPIVITGVRRFNRKRPLAGVRLEPPPAGGELVLTYRDYTLALEFAALHFKSPRDNRYAYRLVGFDPGWIEVDSTKRFAQYSNLPAGKYRFEVKGSNSDGVWSERGATLAVRALPPPWKTWWAYGLYSLALVASALAYTRWQRRKVEREREINRRLRQADRLKDEFLANTSHELRTPLFGITGLAESLIDGATGELSETTRANLSMIVSSGRRLSGLVDDILDFSKLSRKSLDVSRRPVDLRVLVELVLSLSRPLVGSKDLKLVNAVGAELPTADADENRLQQILHNLVGNAIKFTEAGSVEVSAVAEEGRLVVAVSDTGIGLGRDQLERIFEPFEQADASIERVHGGTGLGLAVTKQLVELHGGNLWVDSTPGEGSTFSFTLPISGQEPAPRPRGEHRAERRQQQADDPAFEPHLPLPAGDFRLLIVDDEPVIRQVLINHLSAQGYELVQASSGAEALRLLDEHPFDLVLLDVMMPRMSGYEVCRVLRERSSREQLPVIFLTARQQVSDLVTGFESGANDFLTKPIAKSELLARVAAHLELLDAHRKLARLLEEKTARTAELAATNAELARFTYTVSHDLKSPLVTISGFLGLLERDLQERQTERMEHDIQRIRSAAERMRQLLDDLLELSRVGRVINPREDVSMSAVACEALSQVAGRVADRGVDVEVAANLPVVSGDRVRLLEVFQNLIENAVKYMGDQSSPRIEVGVTYDGGDPVFHVRDNGMGIDASYHEQVFELFERLDAGTDGTGVGLALVQRIVHSHGGRVWVESEGHGRGSVFRFTVPAAPRAAGGNGGD